MGHKHARLANELLVAMRQCAEKYQRARPEIGSIQAKFESDESDDIDTAVHEAALMAYNFESTLSGYAFRIDRGEIPQDSWLKTINESWRFYTADDFPEIKSRADNMWKGIAKYMESVQDFERIMRTFLNDELR